MYFIVYITLLISWVILLESINRDFSIYIVVILVFLSLWSWLLIGRRANDFENNGWAYLLFYIFLPIFALPFLLLKKWTEWKNKYWEMDNTKIGITNFPFFGVLLFFWITFVMVYGSIVISETQQSLEKQTQEELEKNQKITLINQVEFIWIEVWELGGWENLGKNMRLRLKFKNNGNTTLLGIKGNLYLIDTFWEKHIIWHKTPGIMNGGYSRLDFEIIPQAEPGEEFFKEYDIYINADENATANNVYLWDIEINEVVFAEK